MARGKKSEEVEQEMPVKKSMADKKKAKSKPKSKASKKSKDGDRHWLSAPALKRIIIARVGASVSKKDPKTGKIVAGNPRLSKDAIPILQTAGQRALEKLMNESVKMLGKTAKTVNEEIVEEAAMALGMKRLRVSAEPTVTKDSKSVVINVDAGRQTCLAAASVVKAMSKAVPDNRISALAKVYIRAYVEEAVGRLIKDADLFREAGQKGTIREVELDHAMKVVCHQLFK